MRLDHLLCVIWWLGLRSLALSHFVALWFVVVRWCRICWTWVPGSKPVREERLRGGRAGEREHRAAGRREAERVHQNKEQDAGDRPQPRRQDHSQAEGRHRQQLTNPSPPPLLLIIMDGCATRGLLCLSPPPLEARNTKWVTARERERQVLLAAIFICSKKNGRRRWYIHMAGGTPAVQLQGSRSGRLRRIQHRPVQQVDELIVLRQRKGTKSSQLAQQMGMTEQGRRATRRTHVPAPVSAARAVLYLAWWPGRRLERRWERGAAPVQTRARAMQYHHHTAAAAGSPSPEGREARAPRWEQRTPPTAEWRRTVLRDPQANPHTSCRLAPLFPEGAWTGSMGSEDEERAELGSEHLPRAQRSRTSAAHRRRISEQVSASLQLPCQKDEQ